MSKNLWEVRIALGSSAALVREALNKENPENPTRTINFVATKSFVVYLHHHQWHEVLRTDHGIDDGDIWSEGKISFFESNLFNSRIVINSKSTGFIGKESIELKEHLREHDRMEEAIHQFLQALLGSL